MNDGFGDYPPGGGDSPGLWLGLSIAATLCCCMPFGVVGIVFSALAMSARDRGDAYEFERQIGRARGWTIAAIVCGLIIGGIYALNR
ncbi:MAG TPA: CD225/dispanin family protein [Actinocatenispora sp.]